MAMLRLILAVRASRRLAALFGLSEVVVWLIAVGQALQHLNSIAHVVGYAGGFALGNYVGVWLEGRFAIGVNVVRVISRVPDDATTGAGGQAVALMLRREGCAVAELAGKGRENDVVMLNIVVPQIGRASWRKRR